jgi:hypothetical protein
MKPQAIQLIIGIELTPNLDKLNLDRLLGCCAYSR